MKQMGDALLEPRVEVLSCGPAETLRFVVGQRRAADLAAAEELRGVCHWADIHRVDETNGYAGAIDPEIDWHITDGPGREAELRLAGEGAFAVAEFAVTELAAALRLSEPAARAYVGQGLELRDRLPRCWGQVMTGVLPVWKARQIAAETIPLNDDVAAMVDQVLAGHAHKLSLGRVLKAVAAAVLRHQPDEAARRARDAAEKRGVWVEDTIEGTTLITAVCGTPDAVAFDTALSTVARG